MYTRKLVCAFVLMVASVLAATHAVAQAITKQDVLNLLESDSKAQHSKDPDAVCENIGKDALLKVVMDSSTGLQMVSMNREHYRTNLKRVFPRLRENKIQRTNLHITIAPDGNSAVITYTAIQTVTTYLAAEGDYGSTGTMQDYERATIGRENGKVVFTGIDASFQRPFTN
jgi:hypothetical protein